MAKRAGARKMGQDTEESAAPSASPCCGRQRPRPLWTERNTRITATKQTAPPWPAGPGPELTAQPESLAHLPLPGTSCTTGLKPGCFDSGTTSIDQGAPCCCVASDGSCGATPGLCVHVIRGRRELMRQRRQHISRHARTTRHVHTAFQKVTGEGREGAV